MLQEKKGDVKPCCYNPPPLTGEFVEIEIECCGICGQSLSS
jgi:D-arabinose 1-dehydrogenase-like Zn-dependent alcohol dehydrogenase